MKNIIIYSKYDLVRFYLKETVKNIMAMQPKSDNITISVCYSLPELENAIRELNDLVILFDLDDVSNFEKFHLFQMTSGKINKNRLFLFTKETEQSKFHAELMQISSCVLSKTTLQSKIETTLYKLIFCSECMLKVRNTAQKDRSASKSSKILTPRENEIIQYMLSGLSNKEISVLININNKAVSAHRVNIYKKYQSRNILEFYSRFK